jgi:hypothetical protein
LVAIYIFEGVAASRFWPGFPIIREKRLFFLPFFCPAKFQLSSKINHEADNKRLQTFTIDYKRLTTE